MKFHQYSDDKHKFIIYFQLNPCHPGQDESNRNSYVIQFTYGIFTGRYWNYSVSVISHLD